MKGIEQLPAKIQQIYAIVAELEEEFDRPFTPDGHMVGSIGEVLAAYHYDLKLCPPSTKIHDASSKKDDIKVQIKATQRNRIGIRSEPEHLIVLSLSKDGSNLEIYNGHGSLAWENAGKLQKNGQRMIEISKLKKLMASVPENKRLPRIDR